MADESTFLDYELKSVRLGLTSVDIVQMLLIENF